MVQSIDLEVGDPTTSISILVESSAHFPNDDIYQSLSIKLGNKTEAGVITTIQMLDVSNDELRKIGHAFIDLAVRADTEYKSHNEEY